VSRSGYSDEGDNLGLWRHAVERALRGKRGQAFLREMAAALDAMPTKELVAEEVVRDSEHVCALGSVALARKLDVSNLDIYDGEDMGQAFGISRAMAQEIAYMNDEWVRPGRETNAERWTRMRKWVDENTRAET
jgi:hypothetical protein